MSSEKQRLLVFIVAYNAEKTIARVVSRIPMELKERYEVDILIIDDASSDATFEQSRSVSEQSPPFPIHALTNPVNQGYGGNQKLGYHYAIHNGYDFVALIHGDGQYAPECLPDLLEPLRRGEAAAVFGSRMMKPSGALRGGMPLYKFAGNRILTWIENRLLGSHLSEFHSGYRIYSTRALRRIPFDRNSNDFHFDTEIIIQLLIAGLPIVELPIPTFYGDEICYVNGMQYAFQVVVAALKARLQSAGIFYDRRFDCAPAEKTRVAAEVSSGPEALAFQGVREDSRVFDLGCGDGSRAARLTLHKHCIVDGAESSPCMEPTLHAFYLQDLRTAPPELDFSNYDYLLMLDVIEHFTAPEAYLEELRRVLAVNPSIEVMISTANVGYFIPRLMLLLGQFNYSKRGILDLTHTRLFTYSSFERALKQAGFDILESAGTPGPFTRALGDCFLARLLERINRLLIPVSRGLFSYQIFLRVKPRPSLELLLRRAEDQSRRRAEAMNAGSGGAVW